jgi:hypothetical protein
MSLRSSTMALCFSLALPVSALAQEPGETDPVVISSDQFTILLENEHVRVIEYALDPGERDEWHHGGR